MFFLSTTQTQAERIRLLWFQFSYQPASQQSSNNSCWYMHVKDKEIFNRILWQSRYVFTQLIINCLKSILIILSHG